MIIRKELFIKTQLPELRLDFEKEKGNELEKTD
jgi:hypothetical protein